MRDELLAYYERELTFLRQKGAEFAEQYPKVASRLLLEANRCEDPHVERLIEAVALLAARVHLRLDDDFPEITQALLNVVYPHYTRPIPSMSIAEFHLREGKLTTLFRVPRNATLYSRPVGSQPCTFRTCYDTDVWPMSVREAQWTAIDRLDPPLRAPGAVAALRVRIDCWPDVRFADLPLESLRFYLNGEPALVHTLYELLCNNCTSIVLRDPRPKFRQRPIELVADALKAVGFEDDEAMLPHSDRSFGGYRILQEYFAFPERFFSWICAAWTPSVPRAFRTASRSCFWCRRSSGRSGRRRWNPGLGRAPCGWAARRSSPMNASALDGRSTHPTSRGFGSPCACAAVPGGPSSPHRGTSRASWCAPLPPPGPT